MKNGALLWPLGLGLRLKGFFFVACERKLGLDLIRLMLSRLYLYIILYYIIYMQEIIIVFFFFWINEKILCLMLRKVELY